MILGIHADHPEFKSVQLFPGFNTIVAERTEEATQRDTRNGLGKTTLVEIIHFCLGSTPKRDETLSQAPLKDWTFYLDIEINDQQYTISRKADTRYVVIQGDWADWPIKPTFERKASEARMAVNDWTKVLGWLFFAIPVITREEKYAPTFRSLISYFIRRGRDAYSRPFEHYRRQEAWDMQVNTAFLLGLNWEHARDWQILKDKEADLLYLKRMIRSGSSSIVSGLVGSLGELEAKRTRLEEHVTRSQQQLASFQVHPQYQEIEERANALTSTIHQLTNDNVHDRRMMEFFSGDLSEENSAALGLLIEVYEEVGVVLPDSVVKRLEDVEQFHERVTTNRREFLKGELQQLRRAIKERENQIQEFAEGRAKLLDILQTHGALEEYNRLQQRHAELVTELEEVKRRIEAIKQLAQAQSGLKIERERLLLDARSDLDERTGILQRAISLFNQNSEYLYEAPGNLIVEVNKNGFKFDVVIERQSSEGIKQIGKVFTYDLTLAQLWSGRGLGPKFLVHDSAIFDGVDERQIARAIQLAARASQEFGFQYVCCLNSDQIPWSDFDEDFPLQDYVCLTLTDATPDGGLLGFRF